MKNGGAGGGIKAFTLWGTKTLDGPWAILIASEMENDNGEVCKLLFSGENLQDTSFLELFLKTSRVWNYE